MRNLDGYDSDPGDCGIPEQDPVLPNTTDEGPLVLTEPYPGADTNTLIRALGHAIATDHNYQIAAIGRLSNAIDELSNFIQDYLGGDVTTRKAGRPRRRRVVKTTRKLKTTRTVSRKA